MTLKKSNTLLMVSFVVCAVFCAVVFQHGDIVVTSEMSKAYLNGHILDFYDYNLASLGIGQGTYLPSTYFIFALWNIITKIFPANAEWLVYWYKLLPISFYLASGYVFFRILQELGEETERAKAGALIFITTPIGFFSQFIFCQYDSFTVFFVLLGIYFYIKGDMFRFSLFFGIATTFKYFALLVFVPLLLLKEKKIGSIFKYCLIVAVPFLLEVLVYFPSEAFRQGVFGSGPAGYFTGAAIDSTGYPHSLTIIAWIVLCGASYLLKCGDDKKAVLKWGLFFSLLVCVIVFGMCRWHPQWLLFMIPFTAFGLLYNKKAEILAVLDIMMMLIFVIVTVRGYPNNVDQNLFRLGIFSRVISPKGDFELYMQELLHAPELIISVSVFVGVLIVIAMFSYPRFLQNEQTLQILQNSKLLFARLIGGIALFVIPAVICFVVLLGQKDVICTLGAMSEPIHAISETSDYRQYFTCSSGEVEEIRLAVGTYGLENAGTLTVQLYRAANDELLAEGSGDVGDFPNNDYCKINLSAEPVLAQDEQYYMKVILDLEGENNQMAYYRTQDGTATSQDYAMIDGEVKNFNLCMGLYGERAV